MITFSNRPSFLKERNTTMNYWKRARKSIFRTKGKSVILFAVIFVLGNVIAGAIAIQQSTANVEKKMKQQLGATVAPELDLDELMKTNGDGQAMETPEGLSEEMVKKMGASPYVKDYDYSYITYLNVKKFKTYEMKQEGNLQMDTPYKSMMLKGSNNVTPMDFKNKKVELVDGRMLTKEELEGNKPVAMISKKVADENGLSVGDQMVIDTITLLPKEDGSLDSQESSEHGMKIVGLFAPIKLDKKKKEGQGQDALNKEIMEMDQFNTAYVPNGLSQAINKTEMENLPKEESEELIEEISPVFNLKSPDDVTAFKNEIKPLLPKGYKVVASSDEFDKVGASVKRLSKISGYVVLLAVLASLMIISLVVVLFMKDRRHEWGIYLSLGEQRKNVMKQVIAELMVISIAALLVSLVTGNVLGKIVSESLIAGDTMDQVAQNAGSQVFTAGLGTSVLGSNLTNEDVLSNYEVRFSLSYFVTFLAAGMGTIIVSAILPLTYVTRLNPKKIMM